MDHPPDSKLFAGLEQRCRPGYVEGRNILSRAVLKRAYTIHDGLNAL
jgi:hypothetical protein